MAQERQQRERRPRGGPDGAAPVPGVAESAAVHKIDDLLDEIDSVLEENAEEFVRNYVQKGGE